MGLVTTLLSFVRVVRNEANISDVKLDPGGGSNVTAEHFSPSGDDAFPLTTDYVSTVSTQATGRESVNGYLDPLNTPKAQQGEKRIYSRETGEQGRVIAESWLKNDGTSVTNSYKVDGENIVLVSTFEMTPAGVITHTVFDSDGVTPKATTEMKVDGSIKSFNENGSIHLRPDGGSIITTPNSTLDAAAEGSIKGDNGSGSFELQVGGDFVVNTVIIDTGGNITTTASMNSPSMVAAGKELAGHDHAINSGSSAPGPTGPNN